MNADVVIVGAGPAGIFTALELLRRGSPEKIVMIEQGQAIENRRCPKAKTGRCMNCKPYCHITTGFSGAGAFSDWPTCSSRSSLQVCVRICIIVLSSYFDNDLYKIRYILRFVFGIGRLIPR